MKFNIEEMAVELGCRAGSLPSQYLGLPLGAPNKAPSVWDGVEEKSVARRLEKVQRDFLWGGGSVKRKAHLIMWEVICEDKSKGGLGLRKLVLLNKALLVDSKTFEISMEVSGKKQRGIIVERSRGFTSWIRFGESSLGWLLEGVETSCRGEGGQRFVKRWEDGGRKFRLECRTNDAGILSRDETREEEIPHKTESKDGAPKGMKVKSYVEAVNTREVPRERRLGEAVWIQLGEEDVGKGREFLDSCLVGRWGETEMTDADLRDMEKWGKHHWKLQGEMRIARIGGCCCLFVFESKAEANNVLQRGFRRFKESVIHLKRWDPSVGCSQSREKVKEVWVRVMGLPLHLWNREVFKKIGDSCGGFIAVDESTGALKELQWARILVKVEGMGGPSSLQVVIGTSCYAIQLWWEMLPRMTDVIPAGMYGKGKKMEVREEEGGKTRAGGAVEMVQAKGQPVKLTVPSEDGESSCIPTLDTVSDMMQTRGVVAERQKDGGEFLKKRDCNQNKG
ncbi:hypothetical protein CK203_017111 [Vitis vinifera]|uniref:DUF4283 domain-containing protein n=1 Tax=Vitis vinifera TaxID=29760 RepID=A0A438K039_VITVI|nr:hypothetical protein CK203_017111 [Vitis vinifera]